MFEGLERLSVDTSEGAVLVRRGGSGPPVLFLHGIPEAP